MKAAVTALQGKVMPQMISVPIPMATHPNFKAGENYFPMAMPISIMQENPWRIGSHWDW